MSSRAESGNALIEFVAFGVVLFAPIALVATQVSRFWFDKQVAASAATQLARGYSIGQHQFLELESAYVKRYPNLILQTSRTECCIEVEVQLDGVLEKARQVL